jgi:hypothetical protein
VKFLLYVAFVTLVLTVLLVGVVLSTALESLELCLRLDFFG